MPSLKVGGAEVDVEDVQRAAADVDVRAQAAALLAPAHADVIVLGGGDGPAAQHDVAIDAAAQLPRAADRVRQLELFGDEAGLIVFGLAVGDPEHFLQGDDVGVHLTEHVNNTPGLHATVHPATL